MTTVTIDTRRAHLTRVHGEITAIYTWVNDERALILAATHRAGSPMTPGAPVYILLEGNAHAYDDPTQLAHTARKAGQVLGLGESTATWVKIATIIHEGLPDLIRLPAAPPPEKLAGSLGDMTLRADGQTVAQRPIEREREGVSYGA